ncbi:hypothetical protein AB0M68_16970 [Streptomyces sp. NPDC051453]|uniref:hypothetical protein n=1 Tax=Streptomyces sp. NPDC051453 TaxID=3154941 RepID=UPI0034151FF0
MPDRYLIHGRPDLPGGTPDTEAPPLRRRLGDRAAFAWDDTCQAERTGSDGRVTTWDYAPTQTDHRPRGRDPGRYLLGELGELAEYTTAALGPSGFRSGMPARKIPFPVGAAFRCETVDVGRQ